MDRFGRAVHRLHGAIFDGYRDWCQHVGLPRRLPELRLDALRRPSPITDWEYGLEELALYFLLYSEAANLRHTPELLWFIFWVARNSPHRWEAVSCPPGGHPSSPLFAYEHLGRADVMQRTASLRRRHAGTLREAEKALGPVPDLVMPKRLELARNIVRRAGVVGSGSPDELVLTELAAYGDGGLFLERVVSPVFDFLAEHVAAKGVAGVEIADRVAYDDVNDSLCRPEIVRRALGALGCQARPGGALALAGDPYDALLAVGRVRVAPALGWDRGVARDWWAAFAFRKTFVERRSLLTVYRAFFRVWAFFLLEFHLLAVLTWARHNWWAISSLAPSHAALCLLEQVAALWTQRARAAARAPTTGGCLGGLRLAWWGAAGYGGLVAAHAVLSTRPGYAVSLTHGLAGALERAARANLLCLRPLWLLLAWLSGAVLGASSARPPARDHLARAQPRVALSTWLANVLFWALVIGMKGVFDCVRGLWSRGWLRARPGGLDGDLILCIARCLPALIIVFNDMQVFYYIVTALFGFLKGLLQLNLGAVTTFQEVAASFHTAPDQWWRRGVSAPGARRIRSAVEAAWRRARLRDEDDGGGTGRHPSLVAHPRSAALLPAMVLRPRAARRPRARLPPRPSPVPARVAAAASPQATPGPAERGSERLPPGQRAACHLERVLNESREAVLRAFLPDNSTDTAREPRPPSRGVARLLPLLRDGGEGLTSWLLFSDVWNSVVEELREIDLISNAERDNLVFVQVESDPSIAVVPGMRPFLLPVFFYGGQVARAVEVPGLSAAQRVSLSEARSVVVWLLLQLQVVGPREAELLRRSTWSTARARRRALGAVSALLRGVRALGDACPDEKSRRARWEGCLGLRQTVVDLAEFARAEARCVLRVHARGPRGADERDQSRLRNGQATQLLHDLEALTAGRLSYAGWVAWLAEQGVTRPTGDAGREVVTPRARTRAARRRARVLASLMAALRNPTLERPPAVEDMLSWTTLTPHYEEDVLYALDAASVARRFGLAAGMSDLVRENADGVSVMQWLRSAYPREWRHLLERLGPALGGLDPRRVTEADFDAGGPLDGAQTQLLQWASYRGQLLARTTRGIMAYERALALEARLETPRPPGCAAVAYEARLRDLVSSKFSYVIASQRYGDLRRAPGARGRWLARSIEMLMHQHPSLRVATLDNAPDEGGQAHARQCAVLLRANVGVPVTDPGAVHELYRVRLPRNARTPHGVILGEGKPENQNAAIIFCFGEALQAIDMNQDNNLAEALKMRSLLAEFNNCERRSEDVSEFLGRGAGDEGGKESATSESAEEDGRARSFKQLDDILLERQMRVNGGSGRKDGNARPQARAQGSTAHVTAGKTKPPSRPYTAASEDGPPAASPVALVGFREWVFSQDSGALASFAATTEFTFGSIVQRVMTWPGAVRFHYGHPDIWNKLFVMTRGGVSKATRAFHISEDVFAGYNHTLRGGKVKFKEYIAVGKGRDMGFDSINSFESKVAGGNGEQVISRDVHRLATRVDFFRLLAFYHSGPGFFINTALVMVLVYINIWVVLVLSLTGSMLVVNPDTLTVVNALTGQAAAVSVNQAIQLGMLSIVVFAVEMVLEHGLVRALLTILLQLLQGSLMFFTFRARTSAYYFTSDVQYGGAKYIPTGRGYALQHSSFVKVYTSYARSHLYYAFDLVSLLVLVALVDTPDYAALTWSTWLVVVCILVAPFWFNPQTFQIERCKDDFENWILWMTDVADNETRSTWYTWHKAHLDRIRNDDNRLSNPFATSLRGVLVCLPTAILCVASISTLQNTEFNRWIVFGIASGGFWTFVIAVVLVRRLLLSFYCYRLWRFVRTLVFCAVIAFVVCCILFIPGGFEAGVGVKNLIIIIYANFAGLTVIVQLLMYCCKWSLKARFVVDTAYRVLDWILGYTFFFFLFILSFVQVVDMLQGAILYNMRFAKSLQRSRIMESNFLPSYVDRAMERLARTLREEGSVAVSKAKLQTGKNK
ncbi:hypothetical protein QBZ16_000689 [Prototheca wickerhamii]|uniref:1,3-beta-glucan synthase n=1 Tax=Prototheca wickerhamii TaxID=3111 RepID=A0AAD9MM97_PROWI|nr:hypothetical protein QBZ16_000689 [Prototheca wickerhamii]